MVFLRKFSGLCDDRVSKALKKLSMCIKSHYMGAEQGSLGFIPI